MDAATKKTAIVTGATTGIGYATALGLANRGYVVGIVGRNESRCSMARDEIVRLSGNDRVEIVVADLSRLDDVRQAGGSILDRFPKVHVLINNAAVIPRSREVTVDGLEMQLVVNHLAPFLLSNLLVERLLASAPARVVTVSSNVHTSGRIDLEDLQSERDYSPNKVYANTKLMNVLFSNEFARRFQGRGVTSTSLHPGVINTQLYQAYMGRDNRPSDMEDWQRGAVTSLYAATSAELEGASGVYLSDSRIAPASKTADNEILARRLWVASASLCGLETG